MAETIVNLVVEKITDALVKEVQHLWGVGAQVKSIKTELAWVQAFLKDADTKQIVDERQKQWVKDVREVAYRIEDVIDTFNCEIPERKPGKREFIKNLFHKAQKVPVIHNLGDEINDILETLKNIGERKNKYGINSLGEDSGNREIKVRPSVLPDIDDSNAVGFDADKSNIVNELLDKRTQRRCVVSIVGQGGLGKTTLAKEVYNSFEVKRSFDIRMWVTISQEYELVGVLKKIIEEVRPIYEDERGKDQDYFVRVLYKLLKGKKYLLTIDDIWRGDLWEAIETALPNDKNGSRILMTTRITEVAKEADPRREPYELRFLAEEPSLELFLRKALPNDEEMKSECPNDLIDLARQFVKKCGGVPLALVVLGGLLGKKESTYPIWSKVMQTMNWHSSGNEKCMEIIGTSYNDLPLALKPCFMYFAAFPEDYAIRASSLYRMWIAEDFIPREEKKTLEDTAESYLEYLVQRSMIQVSERSHDGSIALCRIHDLLRDVAIQKAKEDNFLAVCSTLDEVPCCGETRRIAVHNVDCSDLMKYVNPNLRTLLSFNSKVLDLSGHKLIKVLAYLDSENCFKSDQIDVKCLEGLFRLKYLEPFQCTLIDSQRSFEKVIGGMKFLQTLDLNYNVLDHLPDCIWNIKTLRHVILYDRTDVFRPPPNADLPNLQTLLNVKNHESWEYANLPNLPKLCTLGINLTEGFPWGLVVTFLHTLEKLVNLSITGKDIPTEIVDMKGFPFYQQLTWLSYTGRLCCHNFDVAMFPPYLTSLYLNLCNLQQDPMEVLGKLHGLKMLHISCAYPKTMRCEAGGFPNLHELRVVSMPELEEWDVEEGAMPKLKKLYISACPKLQVPRNLLRLNTLTELTWDFFNDHSGPLKAKEIRSICKHVSYINLRCVKED